MYPLRGFDTGPEGVSHPVFGMEQASLLVADFKEPTELVFNIRFGEIDGGITDRGASRGLDEMDLEFRVGLGKQLPLWNSEAETVSLLFEQLGQFRLAFGGFGDGFGIHVDSMKYTYKSIYT